jgi:hypothetical protein
MFTRRGKDIFTFDQATGQLTEEQDLAGTMASPPYGTMLAYNPVWSRHRCPSVVGLLVARRILAE